MSKAERAAAQVFFALGDETRLAVVTRLGARGAQSATALSAGSNVSRQAVAKHLRVLADAGLVTHAKRGREVLYVLEPDGLASAREFLEHASARWDRALERLRALVEEPFAATRDPKRRR